MVIYRASRIKSLMDRLPALSEAIQKFVNATTVSQEAKDSNSRGGHFACIVGTDRQSKKVCILANFRPWRFTYAVLLSETIQDGLGT